MGWERLEATADRSRRERLGAAAPPDRSEGEQRGSLVEAGEGGRERMEAGGGWKMSMRTDLGFRLGWVWAVGFGSIRRWLMRDPRDMLMVQSERSKPFDDLMTI